MRNRVIRVAAFRLQIWSHDFDAMEQAFASFHACNGKPTVILMITIKGKGLKPLDEDIILRAAADCRRVVTHNRRAGRSCCSSSWRENANVYRHIGVKDEFGHSGSAWELLKEFGLDASAIYTVAQQMVED